MAEIRRSVSFPWPRARVWAALTDPEALAAWLMPNDFEPRVGRRFTMRTAPRPGSGFDGIVRCEVLELVPPERMVWAWRGGPLDTTVRFDLVETGAGTELRFVHEGFDEAQEAVRTVLARGWPGILARLGALLEGAPTHCEEERR